MAEAVTSPTGARAGFGPRFLAAVIDGLLVGVAGGFLGAVLGSKPGQGLGLLVGVAYFAYLEGSASGQTVGKRAMNIRVIDAESGGPIGPGRAVLRYFARILSAIPCGLGYFWMLWDDNKQTWHDKLTTDVVVPTADYPVAAWPG
jgi:uncharacterized RDD family membrane protein YckC